MYIFALFILIILLASSAKKSIWARWKNIPRNAENMNTTMDTYAIQRIFTRPFWDIFPFPSQANGNATNSRQRRMMCQNVRWQIYALRVFDDRVIGFPRTHRHCVHLESAQGRLQQKPHLIITFSIRCENPPNIPFLLPFDSLVCTTSHFQQIHGKREKNPWK